MGGTIWIPNNPVYINPYGVDPSHTTRLNFSDFTTNRNFSLGRSSVETRSVPLSSGPFTFDIHDITTSIPSPILGSSVDPGVGMGGMSTPYLAHQFKRGHITPSNPFVGGFSLPSSGINTSVHPHGGGIGVIVDFTTLGVSCFYGLPHPYANSLEPPFLNITLMIQKTP